MVDNDCELTGERSESEPQALLNDLLGFYMEGDYVQIEDCANLEQFELIERFDGKYLISNHGRVKSVVLGVEKILKPNICKKGGYLRVSCGREGVVIIHSTVAKHFLPNPNDDKRVIFKDGNKKNPHINNLAWNGLSKRKHSITALIGQSKAGCSDAACCVKFMDGDNSAMDSLIENLREDLYSFVKYLSDFYKNTHDIRTNVDLEGVVQETLCKVISAISRGLLDDATGLLPWSKSIARNTFINASKAEKLTVSQSGFRDDGSCFDYIDYAINNDLIAA